MHLPPLQDLPPATLQTLPQVPQLLLSLTRSLHTLLPATHSGRLGRHVQAEAVQVEPLWQIVPQAPQFLGSELVSVQVPAVHSMIGGEPHVHALPEQTLPPVHEIPHAPQLLVLVVVSTQLFTQSVSAGSQVAPHAPLLQT